MRTFTPREQLMVRSGGIGIGVYLVLFGGLQLWKMLEKRRTDYRLAAKEAQALKAEIAPYESRILHVKKLMEEFHMDPVKLSRVSVVGGASAAIQGAAMGGGVQLGPIRESPARTGNAEAASMQLEATGTIAAVTGLLDRIKTAGFPLIIESLQIDPGSVASGADQIEYDCNRARLRAMEGTHA